MHSPIPIPLFIQAHSHTVTDSIQIGTDSMHPRPVHSLTQSHLLLPPLPYSVPSGSSDWLNQLSREQTNLARKQNKQNKHDVTSTGIWDLGYIPPTLI